MNKQNLPRANRMYKRATLRKQLAFTMIEVLISVVILSVGLLGLAGLQVVGIKGTQHAGMKMQATLATQSLLEKMRSNTAGDYTQAVDCDRSLPKDCSSISADCNLADDLAIYDLYLAQCGRPVGGQLVGGISHLLTNGDIQVSCPIGGCVNGAVQILTSWDERIVDENQQLNMDAQLVSRRLELTAVVK